MKAFLEQIQPAFGSSFTVRSFGNNNFGNKPYWHFHPEYEIVYISNGRGKRHIGDHISYYEDGDLILIGPDLPHFGFTEELLEEHLEIVVQMKPDFLGEGFLDRPEMNVVKQMFEKSRLGLSFSGETKKVVGRMLKSLTNLKGFERMVELLRILELMATSSEFKILNANGFALEVNSQDHERIKKVYEYVAEHFQEEIPLEDAASLISMTIPAFCRYFKKLTNKTFTQFVNEFRVAHACRLLADDHMSISSISFDSGFNNLSHFNKQFKSISGVSPREYRKKLTKVVR